MSFSNIGKIIVDEAQTHLGVSELAASPLGVLAGLTHTEGKAVMDALGVRTISEFAGSKYVLWAQAIATLAKHEKTDLPTPALAAILDEKWQKKRLRDLAQASPAVLDGLSDKDAKVLAEAFGVRTIADLATNRYVLKAQAIANMAMIERDKTFKKAA